jgi:hypothetical protein
MMEASSTSEMTVNFHQTTQRNNPEDIIFIPAAVRTSNLTQVCHIHNFDSSTTKCYTCETTAAEMAKCSHKLI